MDAYDTVNNSSFNHKVVMVGPLPSPITGQSIAFKAIVDGISSKKKVFDLSFRGKSKLMLALKNISLIFNFCAYILMNRKSIRCLYLTTSRSLMGFTRDLIYILGCKIFSIKVINHLHGADFSSFRSRYSSLSKIIDYIYNKIDVSIVLFDSMKKEYEIYPNMKKVVVPNFYSLDRTPNKRQTDSAKLNILYLSNIMYSKGIFQLIEAVNSIDAGKLQVSLHVAGHPMSDQYMTRDEAYDKFMTVINERDNIHYHGTVSGEAKTNLLQNADIFCLPTFYPTEAQPISIIEAMASGCVILTTDHNYLHEMVSEEQGLLIKKESASALTEAIENLALDRERIEQISEANKLHAKTHYSLELYISHLNKIILED